MSKIRAVVESLNAECEPPIRIHEHLKNVCEGATVDVSTVRCWVRPCGEVVEGQSSLADTERTDHPPTVVIPHNVRQADDISLGDCRVATSGFFVLFC